MEILLNSILGIALMIVSIVMTAKEKYATSAIIKYFASYMYISLAYETYQVLPNQATVLLFVALAIGCIGDVLVCLKDCIEQFRQLSYYGGIAFYVAESIILIAGRFSICNNSALLIIISIAVSAAVLFGLMKKKDTSLADKIASPILLASCLALSAIGITSAIASPVFANTLFCIGAVCIGLSACFYVVERHFNPHFAFKATTQVLRYLGQLIITLSMIFILY